MPGILVTHLSVYSTNPTELTGSFFFVPCCLSPFGGLVGLRWLWAGSVVLETSPALSSFCFSDCETLGRGGGGGGGWGGVCVCVCVCVLCVRVCVGYGE